MSSNHRKYFGYGNVGRSHQIGCSPSNTPPKSVIDVQPDTQPVATSTAAILQPPENTARLTPTGPARRSTTDNSLRDVPDHRWNSGS